ncbi:MAG: FAD-dependent oxidoreductase [Acidobacteria bacterium]|nr:FAD-dependent oxidoreductase [Acidobacteriota bacterium]
MKKTDRQLGMHRDITRRDFIHGASLAALSLGLPRGRAGGTESAGRYYPPTLTGLRGSHSGSFEVAHELAREMKPFEHGEDLGEDYDLVVVGGGISGLAAAYFYRQRFGPESTVLILDNHDDFGGHAKRNEFHQGGPMRLVWGGVFNLEYPMFSDTVDTLLAELGVDIGRLLEGNDFNYGDDGELGSATFFDAETYGRDVLIPGFTPRHGSFPSILERLDDVPLSEESRESLRSFYSARTDVLEGRSPEEREEFLRGTSYIDFVRNHGGLTEEAAEIFFNATHGYWGVGADSLSVAECEGAGLPMLHLLGGNHDQPTGSVGGEVAHFPDGNASIARLLVRSLIPQVAQGRGAELQGMDDIPTATFDYSQLDRPDSAMRVRLNSTVVKVTEQDGAVRVSFVRDGTSASVTGKRCVLACYHAVIPHLCPELPAAQKEAMSYQVKRPLLLTNVLLRDSKAADQLGISGAYCPGRIHGATWLVKGIEVGEYRCLWDDAGPAVMQFWGSLAPAAKGLNIRDQHRSSRMRMLAMSFEDYEREVRTVLDGMLGPAGFSAADDILAITVNRWPHGYAYDYLDLWDPKWAPGEAPHEIARRPYGNITFANSDAGANAYSHVAIDEAWRAVSELTPDAE